jgi:broad specificity phosphatase PhoE
MTLYVCRHGRTEANAAGLLLGRADPGLDDLGRLQAEALAAALPKAGPVVSSPLRRCRDTAAAFGRPVSVDERLIELDYGEWDQTPLGDVPAESWAEWQRDPGFRPPGGESLEALYLRVASALDELADSQEPIVIVSHVSPIKAAVAWALGVGVEISWRCFVSPASITEIGTSRSRPSLRGFNDVAHLARLDRPDDRSRGVRG